MELRLWKNVNKKRNSTLVINRDPDATMDVVLKEDTSVDTPTFLLDSVDLSVNYAWWEGRFYFVDDIRRGVTHQYELECTTDYLATFKSYIGNYTAFVERATSNYDTYIPDAALSSKNAIVHASHETLTLDNITSDGCYLLRAVSQVDSDANKTGITTYILSSNDLKRVMDFMFTESNFTDVLTDMAVKSFFNPFQYIVDLRWVPYTKTNMAQGSSATGPVKFGWFNSGVSVPILTAQVVNQSYTLAVPTCYYANNDFRRYDSRYTNFKLYVFGHGTIDLSPMDVTPGGLRIQRTVDFTTGEMITLVRRSDGVHPLAEFKDPFCIPVQISQVNSNLFNSAMDVLSSAGQGMQAAGIAAEGGAGAIASALAGGVIRTGASVINAVRGETCAGITGNGTNGNRAGLVQMPYYILYETAYDSAEFATSVNGRPLCKNIKISTLSGYVQCAGASVNIPGFAGDKEAVNNALNGGFYYE